MTDPASVSSASMFFNNNAAGMGGGIGINSNNNMNMMMMAGAVGGDGGGSVSSAASPSIFMVAGSGGAISETESQCQQPPQMDEPELCMVCNDVATGYHYGTPSCNGCKTFFRRTVMKKQVFQCQYDGNCSVDKSVRCACRHCRFKKCLAVGMNREAIQQNRDPIGYTKRTRRYPLLRQQQSSSNAQFDDASGFCSTSSTPFPGQQSSAGTAAPTPFAGGGNCGAGFLPTSSSSTSLCSLPNTAVNNNNNNFMNSQQQIASTSTAWNGMPSTSAAPTPMQRAPTAMGGGMKQQQRQQAAVSAEQLQEDMLLQRLIGIENILVTIRNSKVTVQKSLTELVQSRSVFEDAELLKKMAMESFQAPNMLRKAEQEDYLYWHERDWFIMIEWAKMVPVYQQLTISDKLALLRHSAITYPSLIQCFYTPDVGPDTIVFPNGAFFDRTMDHNRPTGFQRKNFKMLDNLLNPIRKMQIDQNEFAGAKAVFFLNPGNFEDESDDLGPEAKAQIAVARSAITNALYRYMVNKRGTEEAADKFGKLLLLGTAIATMSCEMKEAVVVADFFDQIRFSGFARQLLLAKEDEDAFVASMTAAVSTANDYCQQLKPATPIGIAAAATNCGIGIAAGNNPGGIGISAMNGAGGAIGGTIGSGGGGFAALNMGGTTTNSTGNMCAAGAVTNAAGIMATTIAGNPYNNNHMMAATIGSHTMNNNNTMMSSTPVNISNAYSGHGNNGTNIAATTMAMLSAAHQMQQQQQQQQQQQHNLLMAAFSEQLSAAAAAAAANTGHHQSTPPKPLLMPNQMQQQQQQIQLMQQQLMMAAAAGQQHFQQQQHQVQQQQQPKKPEQFQPLDAQPEQQTQLVDSPLQNAAQTQLDDHNDHRQTSLTSCGQEQQPITAAVFASLSANIQQQQQQQPQPPSAQSQSSYYETSPPSLTNLA